MEVRNDFDFLENKLSVEQYHKHNDIESWLYNYNIIKVAIENKKDELKVLETLKAVNTESEGKSSKISRPVEDIQAQKDKLENEIIIMELKLKKINKALDALTNDEFCVVKNFYIESKNYKEFIKDMQCEITSCKKLKKRALNKIILAVYGIL